MVWVWLLGLAAFPVAEIAALVVTEDDEHELSSQIRVETRLYPSRHLEAMASARAGMPTTAAATWSAFTAGQSARGPWTAAIDRRSGLVEIAEGAGVPWIPGYGNDLSVEDLGRHLNGQAAVDLATLESLAREFIAGVEPLLGTAGRELRLNRRASGPYSDYLWFVEFEVFDPSGLPIENARVFFRVNNGNLIQFGAEGMPAPEVQALPVRVSRDQALVALAGHVGGVSPDKGAYARADGPGGRDRFLDVGTLKLRVVDPSPGAESFALGQGTALLPVWEFVFRRDGLAATWRVRVDAISGEVLEFVDINHYAQVTGGYWPVSWRVGGVEQAQVVTGWPFATVTPTGGTSNTSGIYPWDGSAQTARHTGPFVNINDNCPGAPGTAGSGAGGDIAFGEITTPNAPGDCQTQLGIADNTAAARQQFWHLNKIMEKGRAYLPANVWLQNQLTANVNINSNCNAFWNGSTVNFYTSGGGCGNTGEDAGISMHEWGHGMDSNDGNGTSVENGTGETYGDFTAALQTHDSCTGQGFLGGNCGGYGNACTSCDGVRDIDWGQHTANAPMTVASFTQPVCPSDGGGGYVGPCGNGAPVPDDKEGHCESYVSSGAVWDLAAADLRSGCSGRNPGMFPDYNCPGAGGPYNEAGAWQTVDRLWYLSRATANQAFTCSRTNPTWTSHGCNAGSNWSTFRAVDDDDGNLANGTPHACQIAAAFNRHDIGNTAGSACAGNNTTCFRACPQPTAPTLNPGTPGNNQVTLDWSPNPAPDVIDVYRNEIGCNAGFTKIAEDQTGIAFTDTVVANGSTYYYQLVRHPVGNEACSSAPSNCIAASPAAGPSARYVDDSANLISVPTDNDADGFVDNCETGRIELAVVNDGNGALTNTRFTVTSSTPAVTVTTGMPVNVGSLAVSSQTTATFDFDLDGATCGQTLDFDISVTADEMTGTNLASFTHEPVEQDLTLTANRTDDFETGDDGWTFTGFAREMGTADSGSWSVHSSSGLNDQCEDARSPIFQPGVGATSVTIAVRYDIEVFSGGNWWDKANVRAVLLSDGSTTVLNPTGARPYNATASGGGLCRINPDDGWADQNLVWGDAIFDLSGLSAGESYVLEVNYNTDVSIAGTGFWFDNVRWTNVFFQGCDGQGDLCVPCTPPAAPTGVAAVASAANQVTVTWNAVAPAPSQYRVYRATGMGGPYSQVGTVGGGILTFDDTGLTAGETYYYVVRAFETCESADSNEASATAFGDCSVAPTFGGLSSVSQVSTGGSCGLRLEWSAGTNNCNSAPVVYNVYRDTNPGFAPGPGNLLASCVPNAFYDDTSVTGGVNYYYKVRAEDDTVGNGGLCRDGNEDGNLSESSGMVSGGTEVLLFEDFDALAAGGLPAGWLSGTFGGSNDWRGARACPGQSAPNVLRYGSAASCTGNYTTNSDALTLTEPVAIPVGSTNVELDFYHRWEFEDNWDGGILYLSSAAEFPTFYAIGSAYLTGQGYNDTSIPKGLETFGAEKSAGYDAGTMQNTVVDLSQFCTDLAQFAADCAGETLYVGFNGFSDGSFTRDGWHVDDVEIRRGGTACTAAPGAVQFLTATATDGQNVLEWMNPAGGSYGSTLVRYSTSSFPDDPTDGTFLADQNDGLGAKGLLTHSGLTDGTTYYYSVFVDNGSGEYSARKTVAARPFDTSGAVKWSYSTGASALAPPGIGSVYGVANDRVLHSMDTDASGRWPGTWTPLAMNGPSQARPPVLPIALGGASKVAFLGSHDGRVYAVNADSGAGIWSSPDLGAIVQGAPAGIFTAFGGAYDLIFAGTRNGGGASAYHGLNLADGSLAWSFTNSLAQGGDDLAIGIISGGASADWINQRLYFASRRHGTGSQNTVWCISFTDTTASLVWARDLGDVDGSPLLIDGKVYVGTNASEVHALDPATGADLWAAPFQAGNGPIKGYVLPRFFSDELLFSTTDRLWSINNDGASASLNWVVTTIPNPSVPLSNLTGGTPYVWVGSGDGRLYQIELLDADPPSTLTSLMLGDGSATVGSPAYDVLQDIAYVGTEAGRVYSVALPLP